MTTKADGHCLGLYQAKGFMENLGVSLPIVSRQNLGTNITLQLNNTVND